MTATSPFRCSGGVVWIQPRITSSTVTLAAPRSLTTDSASSCAAAGAPHEKPRSLGLDHHVGDHLLHELMPGDRLAEALACRRVPPRRVDAGLRDADSPGRDGVAARVERGHRDLESLADLTEAVRV